MSVAFSAHGPVGRIVLSRPERRNALNHVALDELHECVRRAASADLRALVLTGDQDQFCSGADLTELEDLGFTRALRGALDDLAGLAFPTIAAISGACMGLGVQLALACDLRLATPDARFAVPVAKLGLMVDHWTVQRLDRLAGASVARWMLLTARPVTAERAHQIGLVHDVVAAGSSPGAGVLDAADELAGDIARLAPLALSGSKLGLDLLERAESVTDPDGAYRRAFEAAWASDDLVMGRRAFREGHRPEFQGR